MGVEAAAAARDRRGGIAAVVSWLVDEARCAGVRDGVGPFARARC